MKLEKAVEDFEDNNSAKQIYERISDLRQALMWDSFTALKDAVLNNTISNDQEEKREACMKYFADIERMFLSDVKANKILGGSSDKFNNDFINKIKENRDGTLGEVVRDLK